MKKTAVRSLLLLLFLFPGTTFARDLTDYIIDLSCDMSSHATSHGTDASSDSTMGSKPAPTPSARVEGYVSRNYQAVQRDISKGNGEALDALAELMEIPVSSRQRFMATLQNNFNRIYPTGKEDATTVVKTIRTIYKEG